MARAINSYFILTQTRDKINNQNALTVSLLPKSTPQEMSKPHWALLRATWSSLLLSLITAYIFPIFLLVLFNTCTCNVLSCCPYRSACPSWQQCRCHQRLDRELPCRLAGAPDCSLTKHPRVGLARPRAIARARLRECLCSSKCSHTLTEVW